MPVPKDVSMMDYIKYILDNIHNETCIGDIFAHLLALSANKSSPASATSASSVIFRAMVIHMAVERVTELGLRLLDAQLQEFPRITTFLFILQIVGLYVSPWPNGLRRWHRSCVVLEVDSTLRR